MWVYKQIREGSRWLYTVGYYAPDGDWVAESDHSAKENAASRVNYLNGGSDENRIQEVRNAILEVAASVQAIRRV